MIYDYAKARDLIRGNLRDAHRAMVSSDNDVINDAIAYFTRHGDIQLVRGAMKDRFAVSIARQHSVIDGVSDDGAAGYEVYRKGLVGEQIDMGMIETITSGTGGKIISALATLFSGSGQVWDFVDGTGENSEDAEELITSLREAGMFDTSALCADYLACAVGGSAMYLSWAAGGIKYHTISPTCIYAIYSDTIIDDGIERPVDHTDIEDATAVVIRLSESSDTAPDSRKYLAFFGKSGQYPLGRQVTYTASRWDAIPDVGFGISEYTTIGGEIANPMVAIGAEYGDEHTPSYPVVLLHGGHSMLQSSLLDTTDSLYHSCIEIDIGFSRLLKDSLNAARGKDIFTNQGMLPLPRCTEANVSLLKGQTLDVKGRSASEAVGALSVLNSLIVSVGSGYSVPDYYLVQDITGTNGGVPSGVALAIKAAPLTAFREFRAKLNSPQVAKLYAIERALVRAFAPEQAAVLDDVSQSWDPGQVLLPEDKKIKAERIKLAMDAGLIDYVGAVKDYHNLATEAEAMSMIEKMSDRKDEFPAPTQQQPRRGARAAGFGLGFGKEQQ